MFLNVSRSLSGAVQSLVTIPQAAVAYNPYGALVYVMHDDRDAQGQVRHVVRQQFVTHGGVARRPGEHPQGALTRNDVVVTAEAS